MIYKIVIITLMLLISNITFSDEFKMKLPEDLRRTVRNEDGSCVQCSIVLCGFWNNNLNASQLLWDSEFGKAQRGGSYPSRVEKYAQERGLKLYNITGDEVYKWMDYSMKTGRGAAIGAGSAHFQTLYGKDFDMVKYFVCNNNSPQKIDEYNESSFRRLHEASGKWVVILYGHAPADPPIYYAWWVK